VGKPKLRKKPEDIYKHRELTPYEIHIIRFVTDGLKNKEIAVEVNTTEDMIKNHIKRIFDKTGVWNRTQLALWYLRNESMLISPQLNLFGPPDPLDLGIRKAESV